MKIDDLGSEGANIGKTRAKGLVDGVSFKEVLDGLAGKAKTVKTGQAGPISQVPFLTPPFLGAFNGYGEVVSNLEGVFSDLDMLNNALGNEDLDLSQLEPMINELVEKKDELSARFKDMPEGELKGIVSDVLSLVLDQVNRYHVGYAA